jgi:hypothetical protein
MGDLPKNMINMKMVSLEETTYSKCEKYKINGLVIMNGLPKV